MKTPHTLMVIGICSMFASTAMAFSGSLSSFQPRTLPVLVQVNSQGKVTQTLPAVSLSPVISRLLSTNLDEIITKPAYDRGRPVASQFVINLALVGTPLDNGKINVHFAYVSEVPVPGGSWHWENWNDRRFALVANGYDGRARAGWQPDAYPRSLVFGGKSQGASRASAVSVQPTSIGAPGSGRVR
jgi:hypothetical protein